MPPRRKDPALRARTNPEKIPFQLVELHPAPCPNLPRGVRIGDKLYKWPEETKQWWAHWRTSPLNDRFTAHDWDFLLVTAILHAKFFLTGDNKIASELRMREGKFGVTPEDRAKLRIITVDANNKEEEKKLADERNARVAITGDRTRLTAL